MKILSSGVSRRRFVSMIGMGGAGLLVGRPVWAAGTAQSGGADDDWLAGVPASGRIHFDVFVAGSRDGFHTITFQREGDELLVNVEVKIRVRLMFITVFDYRQSVRERWRGGRLVSFQSETVDGDNVDRVRGTERDGRLHIDSRRAGQLEMPADILPTTAFWRRDAIGHSRFLDAARGDYRDVQVKDLGWQHTEQAGRQEFLQRYHVASSRNFDVWYDSAGQWRRLEWSGFGVTASYIRA